MGTLKQKTAFGPGIYRGHKFDKDRLQSFVDSSNLAIQAGIPIPLLIDHAPLNATDGETAQYANRKGAGWVKRFFLEDDSLGWEADSVSDEHAKEVNEGRMKFTSPEFRDAYKPEKEGTGFEGPIIRHVAITPLPSNPTQGQIEVVALAENVLVGAYQFTEEERKPIVETTSTDKSKTVAFGANPFPPKAKDGPGNAPQGDKESPEPTDAAQVDILPAVPAEAPNPDMPPVATDRSKLQAVLAGLNQKGIVLPSDFDFQDEAALSILLAALNSNIKAEQEHEMDEAAKAEKEDGGPVQESAMPFSEDNYHNTLVGHGFVAANKPISGGGRTYQKGNTKVHIGGHAGGWARITKHVPGKSEGHFEQGDNHESLAKHLSTTQHVEQVAEQFTESELAALPPKARQAIEAGVKALAAERTAKEVEQAKAQQAFEEQRVLKDTTARKDAINSVKAAPIPAGLKSKLLVAYGEGEQFGESYDKLLAAHDYAPTVDKRKFTHKHGTHSVFLHDGNKWSHGSYAGGSQFLSQSSGVGTSSLAKQLQGFHKSVRQHSETIQFSEGNEQPVYTGVQVAMMFAEAIPEHLRFRITGSESQTEDAQFFEKSMAPLGNGMAGMHVSPERAEAVLAAGPLRSNGKAQGPSVMKSISDLTAEENARYPNNVMRG